MKLRYCLLVLSIGLSLVSLGQSEGFPQPEPGQDPVQLFSAITPEGWYFLQPQVSLTDAELIEWLSATLPLATDDALRLARQGTDDYGQEHRHYQQLHRGIPVLYSSLVIHRQGATAQLMHQHLVPRLDLNPRPQFGPDSALALLLAHYQLHRLAFENPQWQVSRQQDGVGASWLPEGKLWFVPVGQGYRLAYRYQVRLLEPDDWREVWLDAREGGILAEKSLRRHCRGAEVHGQTAYYGLRPFTCRKTRGLSPAYELQTCGEVAVATKYFERNSFGEPRSWWFTSPVSHSTSLWDRQHQAAVTAHWAGLQTWHYYAQRHGWVGPDGTGGELRLLVDWDGGNGDNYGAYYEPDGARHYVYLGQEEGNTLATLDVIGHEYAHALIGSTCGLRYEREPGALQEALADMMGALVEQYVRGEEADWMVAAEASPLRSLSHPEHFGAPSRYEGPFWQSADAATCDETNNYCGIHQNSGVGGKWFHLLVAGGEQNGQRVYGLGYQDAGDLIFRTITRYLEPRSDYRDARLASIQAAIDLFGRCSNQVAQVRNAWAAVGLGAPNEQLCISIQAPQSICLDGPEELYLVEANVAAGAEIQWVMATPGLGYHYAGERQEQLLITRLTDTLTELKVMVNASLDSLRATHQVTIPVEVCNNRQRQEVSLPDTDQWTLYPNPAHQSVHLFLPEGYYPAQLTIRELTGRTIWQKGVHSRYTAINLERWSPGLYLFQLNSPQGLDQQRLRIE